MTKKRVIQAAYIRGFYFDGVKCWQNNTVGYGYCIYIGYNFFTADTLQGIYNKIMQYPKV